MDVSYRHGKKADRIIVIGANMKTFDILFYYLHLGPIKIILIDRDQVASVQLVECVMH